MTEKQDRLESFAKRCITRLNKGTANTDSLERAVCRHIESKNEKVSSFMVNKLVEWLYGKPKERDDEQGRSPLGLGFNEPASEKPTRVC